MRGPMKNTSASGARMKTHIRVLQQCRTHDLIDRPRDDSGHRHLPPCRRRSAVCSRAVRRPLRSGRRRDPLPSGCDPNSTSLASSGARRRAHVGLQPMERHRIITRRCSTKTLRFQCILSSRRVAAPSRALPIRMQETSFGAVSPLEKTPYTFITGGRPQSGLICGTSTVSRPTRSDTNGRAGCRRPAS